MIAQSSRKQTGGLLDEEVTNGLRRLAEVLEHIEALPWTHALYLSASEDWTVETTCAVLDPDDYGDDEEAPEFALRHGLQYALGIPQVQDVVRFELARNPEASVADLLSAFLYYYDHDAFKGA